MNIAFQHFGSPDWQASNSFLRDAVQALRSLGASAPEITLVVSSEVTNAEEISLSLGTDKVVQLPAPAPASTLPRAAWHTRLYRRLRRGFGGRPSETVSSPNPPVANLFQNLDCFFSIASGPIWPIPAPRVSWIFDFQHIHLPNLFSAGDRAQRNAAFRHHAEAAAIVLVKTEAIKQDFERFAPDLASKVRVARFVASVSPTIYDQPIGLLLDEYNLPKKFILVPNQFWKHKNHMLILRALRRLKERQVEPVIVCTGNLFDPRDPHHFGELLRQASLLGVREQLIVLGVLPKREQVLTLMRQSICVLNPSLFEGFGYTAAESISIGKQALLSDLPAHREQEPPRAIYFDPQDESDLAAKIESVWNNNSPGPDMKMEATAREQLPKRQQEFGQVLMDIAVDAIESQRRSKLALQQ